MVVFLLSDMTAKLVSVEELVRDKYEDQLMRLISASHALHTSNVDDCFSGHGLGFYISETTGSVIVWICLDLCC